MRPRTVVKVCGLTSAEDATWALGCGADWLGFIVHGESPRRVSPEQVNRFLMKLPQEHRFALLVDLVEIWGALGADEALFASLKEVTGL